MLEKKILEKLSELHALGVFVISWNSIFSWIGFRNTEAIYTLTDKEYVESYRGKTCSVTKLGLKMVAPVAPPTSNSEQLDRLRVFMGSSTDVLFTYLSDGLRHEHGQALKEMDGAYRRLLFAKDQLKSLGLLDVMNVKTVPRYSLLRLTDTAFPFGRPRCDVTTRRS